MKMLVGIIVALTVAKTVAATPIIGARGEPGSLLYVADESGNLYIEYSLRLNVFAQAGVSPGTMVGLAAGCTTAWLVDSRGNSFEGTTSDWHLVDNVFTSAGQAANGRTIQFMGDDDCVMYAFANSGEVFTRTMRKPDPGTAQWQFVGTIAGEQPTLVNSATWGQFKSRYRK